jgi:hypothetical protein
MKNPTTFTNSAIEDKLTDLLLPEEKVLWSYENAQAPAENKAFIAFGAVVTILWCIPVLGFGLPLVVGLIGSGGGLIIIFPLLFITIGVGQLVLLIYAFLRRNRFAYVVSNQRVLMLNSFQPVSHRIFEPEQLLLASIFILIIPAKNVEYSQPVHCSGTDLKNTDPTAQNQL